MGWVCVYANTGHEHTFRDVVAVAVDDDMVVLVVVVVVVVVSLTCM